MFDDELDELEEEVDSEDLEIDVGDDLTSDEKIG